jgi:hypothetical protein
LRRKLIACEIFFREICHVVSASPTVCDLEFLPKGLHDLGAERMLARVQAAVDAVPADRYEAVLMGYALCNNGLAGLTARHTPLVIPRSHDCIAVFMGSAGAYRQYFDAHPGAYYKTSGWTERNDSASAGEETVQQRLGLFMRYEDLVEKYGEENAKYVMETMGDSTPHYDRLTYIRVGLPCDDAFAAQARADAAAKGWAYEEVKGSMDWLRRLIDGPWGDEFLVVPPGRTVRASYRDDILALA